MVKDLKMEGSENDLQLGEKIGGFFFSSKDALKHLQNSSVADIKQSTPQNEGVGVKDMKGMA